MNADETPLLAAVCAAVAVAGVVLALSGAVGWSVPERARRRSASSRRLRTLLTSDGTMTRRSWWAARRTRVLAAVAAGAGVWLFTSWLGGAILAVVVVAGLPWMLNPGRGSAVRIERLEALEEWVRRMSDVHTVGISLEAAITASLRSVPEPIAPDVKRMVARLGAGWKPADAYRAFAEDLDDATGDMVCALMLLHATDRGAGLGQALTDLSGAVAEEVMMRRRVEADRAKPRANARWVTLFCLIVFGLCALSGNYVQPYSTPIGSLVLALLACAFGGLLVWMRRMANMRPNPRFLSPADRTRTPDPDLEGVQ